MMQGRNAVKVHAILLEIGNPIKVIKAADKKIPTELTARIIFYRY